MRLTMIAVACYVCAVFQSGCATVPRGATRGAPSTGSDVLQRMHDAYDGHWYATLTFTQKTTQRHRDGTDTVSTWYESLRYTPNPGTQLRIDLGPPKDGNGVLYTADSTWRIRDGRVGTATAGGNEFLPLIEGVYMQAVSRTASEIESMHVDMNRVSSGTWDGRPVWIVGASSPSDSTVPQFWVDAERNVVVRMLLSPAPGTPSMDIRLDKYVPLAGGWLATRVAMSVAGVPRQTEEYRGWKAAIPLPAALFDPVTWTTAPHWASSPSGGP